MVSDSRLSASLSEQCLCSQIVMTVGPFDMSVAPRLWYRCAVCAWTYKSEASCVDHSCPTKLLKLCDILLSSHVFQYPVVFCNQKRV